MNPETPAKRILLVDDDHQLLKLVSRLLIPQFDIVGSMHPGQEAIDAVRNLKPDVIVLDIATRGLGGIATAALLKEAGLPAIVVFLTSMEDAQWIESAMAIGARGFVFKGSIFRDLPIAIAEVLAGRTFISSIVQ